MSPVRSRRAGALAAILSLAGAVHVAGCADGGSSRRPDAGGHETDAGAHDGGAHDAGVDASSGRDAGPLLPQRCNPEVEYFEDEFGRQAYCVFVATTGDDEAGEGTVTAPYRTIGRGIEVAIARGAATGRVHAVAVSRGTYDERVVLASGISVYGQFDAEDRWSRAEGNTTTVRSREIVDGRIEGVVAEDVDAPTVFEGFTIDAGPAPATSRNVDVYGVRVAGSAPVLPELGGLVLRNLVVDASHGAAGEDGVAGGDGADGLEGTSGGSGDKVNGDRTPGGAGAVSICGTVTVEATRGGAGGEGGGDDAMGCGTYREDAQPGVAPPALASCAGGGAGDACSCVSPIDYEGEPGGAGHACAATPATAGAAAVVSTVRGEVADGVWVPRAGDRGGDGAPGVGGSGGGGGGSGCDAGGWGTTGGGGGGGGSGGCGGLGGEGGRSGGSSFGLFASHSTFAVPGSSFQSRLGGRGGAGAVGGGGGAGGPGGPGGPGGYAGGRGGDGQAGGGGGPGAGGPGGSSVAALLCESEVDGLELGGLEEGVAGEGGAAAEGGVAGIRGVAARIVDDCSL